LPLAKNESPIASWNIILRGKITGDRLRRPKRFIYQITGIAKKKLSSSTPIET